MDNIIDIELTSRSTRRDQKLWQYDYGQMLRISGKEFPKVTEVQFSLQRSGGHTLDRIGTFDNGVLAVQIPNELLQNKGETSDYTIYAFVYLSGDKSGNTKYMIQLPVESRPEPTDPSEDPSIDPSIFKDAVNAVNASANRAEAAEKSARESAAKAKGYAESAGKSKEDVENARDNAITAIDTAKESALSNIASKTDESVLKIQRQTEESQNSIKQSIADATEKKTELNGAISNATDAKGNLEKAVQSAGNAKTELDASVGKASEAKSALDSSISSAGEQKSALDTTVAQANTVDASLKEHIGSAEQIQANVEQIAKNKADISSLNEELAKNVVNDAKTERKLDALWKLNQGISYQFETDSAKAYQKDIPSGAKLATVKQIGGRTIVWNQMLKPLKSGDWGQAGGSGSIDFSDNGFLITGASSTWAGAVTKESLKILATHKYYVSLNARVMNSGDNVTIAVSGAFPITEIGRVISVTDERLTKIIETSESAEKTLIIANRNTTSDYAVSDAVCVDLTKMFGAGNEPSTPEEFEAMFPEDYYPYNEGELMSMPVNEVVEQGKNYFDFSKLVSDGVNAMDYEKQTITVPAYTNNTGYNQTLRDLCPGITPGTYVFSMQISNPEGNPGSYFLEVAMDFPINTPIELTDELLDNHIAWYNNLDSEIENVISKIQIEKNNTKTSYSQYYQKSHPIPQAILDLDGYGESGNFIDFVEKKYHKVDRIIDISDIIGDTFQEPIEVEAGGTLTFQNSNGDGYRLPIPNEEEYIVSLAEVGGGASE